MTRLVGVRFKKAGRIYHFDPTELELAVDEWVVVEGSHGLDLAQVAIPVIEVELSEGDEPPKAVQRKAETADLQRAEELASRAEALLPRCAEKVSQAGLPMKLLASEFNLEGNHLTIFFGAAGRVDFRELVRELAAIVQARVELRQVGPRDEAKLLGGYGRCGRPLCCTAFLCEFSPVSIRMAKEQDLPLSPVKISGLCGRLLCCLAHEVDTYHQFKECAPKIGEVVDCPMGSGRIVGYNPIKETLALQLESQVTIDMPIGQLIPQKPEPTQPKPRRRRRRRRPGAGSNNNSSQT